MCRTAQGLVWLRWSERDTVRNEDPDVEGTGPCGVLQDIVRLDRKNRKPLEGSESRSRIDLETDGNQWWFDEEEFGFS